MPETLSELPFRLVFGVLTLNSEDTALVSRDGRHRRKKKKGKPGRQGKKGQQGQQQPPKPGTETDPVLHESPATVQPEKGKLEGQPSVYDNPVQEGEGGHANHEGAQQGGYDNPEGGYEGGHANPEGHDNPEGHEGGHANPEGHDNPEGHEGGHANPEGVGDPATHGHDDKSEDPSKDESDKSGAQTGTTLSSNWGLAAHLWNHPRVQQEINNPHNQDFVKGVIHRVIIGGSPHP